MDLVSTSISFAQEIEYATGTKFNLPTTKLSLQSQSSLQKTTSTQFPLCFPKYFLGFDLSGTILVEYARLTMAL